VAKYEVEKTDIMNAARKLEMQRDDARAAATEASKNGGGMGQAIAIFQSSIALSSICLVTRKRPLWYLSMLLAVLATARMVQVWMS
jgi:hypothetical protein